MIDGKNLFDQSIKNDIKKLKQNEKNTASERDYYKTRCFLDYNYFIKHHKMIAIDLSKQQAFDAGPKEKK